MKNYKSVEQLIFPILEEIPSTRDDDKVLYIELCKKENPQVLKMGFEQVFSNLNLFDLPSYDTVSRCRRKIQAKYPLLRGSEKATNSRYENWKEAREYAEI